jgi:hypothetical protein
MRILDISRQESSDNLLLAGGKEMPTEEGNGICSRHPLQGNFQPFPDVSNRITPQISVRPSMKKRSVEIVFGMIQTGALQGLPVRVVGAHCPTVGAGAIQGHEPAFSRADHQQVDSPFRMDYGSRRTGFLQERNGGEIQQKPFLFPLNRGTGDLGGSTAQWENAGHSHTVPDKVPTWKAVSFF